MDSVQRKVRALQRLTVQNGATPFEAAAARTLANTLIQKYGLNPKRAHGRDLWIRLKALQSCKAIRDSRSDAIDSAVWFVSKIGKAFTVSLVVLFLAWLTQSIYEEDQRAKSPATIGFSSGL